MRPNRIHRVLQLAVVAWPCHAHAQPRHARPEMIPSVVVYSAPTMGMMFGDDTLRFTVGRLPEHWPAALAPGAGGRVVGGSTQGPFRSMVVSYPRSTNALAAYGRIAAAAGFRPHDSTSAPPEGGFNVMAPTSALIARGSRVWCDSAHSMLAMAQVDSTPTTRRFALMLIGGKGISSAPCGTVSPDHTSDRGSRPSLAIPPLPAPLGAKVSSSGMSSGGDSFSLRADADMALSESVLITHYAAELERAGWKRRGPIATSAGNAVLALSARDAGGEEWEGALIMVTMAGHRALNLTMAKVDRVMGPFD